MAKKYTDVYDIMAAYKKAGGKVYDEPTPTPVHHMVKPTEKNYANGYVKRYFVVKYDGTSTVEVSKDWLKDNGEDCPNTYSKHAIVWYITDYSTEPIQLGATSARAESRNRFTVEKLTNDYLKDILSLDYEQFYR
jgi:hypothetical protein